jgi:IS30 family transposase
MKKYQQLTLFEREQIGVYKAMGKSQREIAKLLDRDHRTIGRELKRNDKAIPLMRGYVGCKAHLAAKERKQQAGKRTRLKKADIRHFVQEQLKLGWTPEQIAAVVSVYFPTVSLSHEAIYQYIYNDFKEGISFLPRRHPKRFLKQYSRKRQKSNIPNPIRIDQRPIEINNRHVFGHWESDSVVSYGAQQAINVLVERQSRLVKLRLLKDKTAATNQAAICDALISLPADARQSITYDNGSENANHELINDALKTVSYFCQPYHSWEKGSVEHMNGLLRRFIPKKMNLDLLTQQQLDQIEYLLNHRPRKCLNFKTPYEIFNLQSSGALPL